MSWHELRLAPGRLLALLLVVAGVPMATLLWLGWQVLDRDWVLEDEQRQDRVERAADDIVAALQRAIAATELGLADTGRRWPDGAVALRFRGNEIETSPGAELAYLPAVKPLREAPSPTFAASEEHEFRNRDYVTAAATLKPLLRSPDSAVRAGALLRLGRNLQQIDAAAALDAYRQLAAIQDVGVDGVPAALAARYARCRLLERTGRAEALSIEAAELREDLRTGRWDLTAAVYALYYADTVRWTGAPSAASSEAVPPGEQLAIAAQRLWAVWQAHDRSTGATWRHELAMVGGAPVVVLWEVVDGTLRAFLATSTFVESSWLSAVAPILEKEQIHLSLRTLEGEALPVAEGTAGSPAAGARTAARRSEDTRLPWRLTVAEAVVPGPGAEFLRRRRLLVAGLALLVATVTAASVAIAHAVARELAVARLQSDFVAAVSHEFRTPLTTLRQFTELLREDRHMDAQRQALCYDAQSRATDRLTRLVESLLDFGRMEAGVRRYAFVPMNVSAVVVQVVDEFRRQCDPTSRRVIVQAAEPIEAAVDEQSLSQALWNLLDNATKYSPESTPIEVTVSRADQTVRIAVRDWGLGVPSQERKRIFTKFYRGEEAQDRGIKGTGLGLAMVQEIVAAHKGTLDLDSVPSRGSTFTIVIPLGGRLPAAADAPGATVLRHG